MSGLRRKMLTLTLAVVTLLTLEVNCQNFDPGCSFVGGSCMYTVKLGHENQCDKVAGGGDSSSCCGDISEMKADLISLKTKYNQLLETLQDLQREDLTEQQMIEVELNKTKAELEKQRAQSDVEIKGLREDLSNTLRELSQCKAALGVSTNDSLHGLHAGDISMTYCSFNNGSSDWCVFSKLASQIDFSLMTRGSGSSTGPKFDHSTGTRTYGQYVSLDSVAISNQVTTTSSSSSVSDKVAKIESSFLEPAPNYCILFWYMMDGVDVRQLEVTIRIGGGTGYPVFTETGDHGDQWMLGQVELDHEYTSHQFKVDFVATSKAHRYRSGSSYYARNTNGDIALDDIYIFNSTCKAALKCPADAYLYTDAHNVTTCYTVHSSPMTWRQAYDVCRSEGPKSALVSINSQVEQDYLSALIKSSDALKAVGQNGFYTSGQDLYQEKYFSWSDRGVLDRIQGQYQNWHQNQPNNVGGNQDCLLLEYPDDDFEWGDVDCDSAHPFICEARY